VDTRARGYLKPRVTVKTAKAVKHAAFYPPTRRPKRDYPLLMATKVKAKKAPKKSTTVRSRRGRATSSRVSSKNQITIPVEVLREMSLKPGDRVEFHLDKNNRLVITPIDSEWLKTLDEVLGSMTGMWDGFDLRKEREEWDSKYS